jgi:phytoene desaturase
LFNLFIIFVKRILDMKIAIIGSGFSSLAASCYLAQAGHEVIVYEKLSTLGGRARRLQKEGFTFDMGPTWYWMPDVFENFFNDFGKKPSDYYQLEKLDPGYSVYFENNERIEVAAQLDEIIKKFESIEKGSGEALKKFILKAAKHYEIAIKDLVYKPGVSFTELINWKAISNLDQFVVTIKQEVAKKIKTKKLQQLLEFPVLFLGAKPSNTPGFYSFMNYADFGLGTWHPKKGMYSVVEAMVNLAQELGVKFQTNCNVTKIETKDNKAIGILANNQLHNLDVVLSGADYHFSETLLPQNLRQYSENYWKNKTFAPSALLFYVGLNKKLKNVNHHTLFFDTDFELHAKDIYDHKKWCENPLFYASFPSITDDFFAPEGKESATFLIPIANNLEDTAEIREKYFNIILERLEKITNQSVRDSIVFKESFCINDFKNDYNSYGGNAYGLANTLFQTAFLRPKLKSKKVKNLFFTGQLTVPGPGVPPALISGKLVSELILKKIG